VKSQNEKLRELMSRGWVDPQDALRHVGTMRLAARVRDLRDAGVNVVGRWASDGCGRWKEYRIV